MNRIVNLAEFDLTSLTSPPRFEGANVIRSGKFFEVGDFPDKEFALTEAEADAAVSTFAPAPLNVEHMPTIFDGALGTIRKLWRQGKDVLAEYAIPKWLHDVTGGEPIKVSSEWDRDTKRAVGGALVLNPRIKDAAIMAAFSAGFADRKPMQRLHDNAADYGAECGGKSYFTKAAEFMTPDELKALQHVHDHAVKNGADCNAYATRKEMYFSDTSHTTRTAGATEDDPQAGGSGGKDKPTMSKWETFLEGAKALFVKAGIELEGESPADKGATNTGSTASNAADAANVSMSADMKALLDTQAKQIADANAAIVAMKADQDAERKRTQLEQAARRITDCVRKFYILPSEAPAYAKDAEEDFAAFSKAIEKIEKRAMPVAMVGGYRGDAAELIGAASGGHSDFHQAVKTMADEKKMTFSEATAEVMRTRPELARAAFDDRPTLAGAGE